MNTHQEKKKNELLPENTIKALGRLAEILLRIHTRLEKEKKPSSEQPYEN